MGMSWLHLDPASVAARVRASGLPARLPSLGASLLRGVLGFTLVSVGGFAPWALGAAWFQRTLGEAGMYATCAAVFIGLSGPLLHRLIIGPGSLSRFYLLFGAAFIPYAVAWIVAWMSLHRRSGHAASLTGLFIGTAFMGSIFAHAFDARGAALRSIASLFVLNTLGYYVGGWVEGAVAGLKNLSFAGLVAEKPAPITAAMLLWGVCYGIGFGAGLGLAFHFCQRAVREQLAA
jgi:hypothetical protein